MRSQIRFVMHPHDEAALITQLLGDPAIVLIDGPRWFADDPARHIKNFPTGRVQGIVGGALIAECTPSVAKG